jgi:hypothetical protein
MLHGAELGPLTRAGQLGDMGVPSLRGLEVNTGRLQTGGVYGRTSRTVAF